MSKITYYQTTTLPYINADPHIGFALEIIQADTIARYKKLQGYDVVFNFGTDEHGQKIYQKAKEQNKEPKDYVDEYAKKFDSLKKHLNLSYNHFIRTTDEAHKKAAQEFWKVCEKNDYIYKKNYKAKYCVGCEMEKTDSELNDGRCPEHPNRKIETREEENYFFRFSDFQSKLLDLYSSNPDFVIPSFRQKEIRNFVEGGLQDFSISRLKEKMPWGIEVPGDKDHVMYVWFDALINYISSIGWPNDKEEFNKYWPVIQFAGKDNLRQQSAIWQSMLMAAGLPPSKQIIIHGFITLNGQKISKSLGNTINPYDLVKKYGTDALRYYLLAKIHPFKDSDFTQKSFHQTYNGELANGLGNTVSRITKLSEIANLEVKNKSTSIDKTTSKFLENYRFDKALENIWNNLTKLDKAIDENKLWENPENKKETLNKLVNDLRQISTNLTPFMPDSSQKISNNLKGPKIASSTPLFPRIK